MCIMFTLPCFIYYHGFVCSYFCQTCSSFKWNLRGAALMRNDLQACLRCASWEWRHDMIWAEWMSMLAWLFECRCHRYTWDLWGLSLNWTQTLFVWPSLVWSTQHPHLSCDIMMYQRGITSTTCSWLIFHHRFKCTCTLPSINNSSVILFIFP